MWAVSKVWVAMYVCFPVAFAAAAPVLCADPAAPSGQLPLCVQGQLTNKGWTQDAMWSFYTQDQGSRLIPLAWLRALKRNGIPFLAQGLSNYGYLLNPLAHTAPGDTIRDVQLPVGFTTSGPDEAAVVGMSCAACHTRDLTYRNQRYRIDGGPAIVDFESLLRDLEEAVKQIRSDPSLFKAFANDVFKPKVATAEQSAQLCQEVNAWFSTFDGLISHALPLEGQGSWGLGRLDAVGMIFDRLTGIDISQDNLPIVVNIKRADAPVRYPFLWGANLQDKTQWPGFAPNGYDLLALVRNLGEVYGVFGTFRPQKVWPFPPLWNFNSGNSADFPGLGALEDLLKRIPPPSWPFDKPALKLVKDGEVIYKTWRFVNGKSGETETCQDCHGEKPVLFKPWNWLTPILNVGTDSKEYEVMSWTVEDPGSIDGMLDVRAFQLRPGSTPPVIKKGSADVDLLASTVVASIAQHEALGTAARGTTANDQAILTRRLQGLGDVGQFMLARFSRPSSASDIVSANGLAQLLKIKPELADLTVITPAEAEMGAERGPPNASYESRVLHGIWAAAPYLHNGSVPTLDALLKPACSDADTDADAASSRQNHVPSRCRPRTFQVGLAFDPDAVGLATDQGPGASVRVTTDSTRMNGDSRAGHEFGAELKPEQRRALLEYLKTL